MSEARQRGAALEVVRRLREAGFEAYLAGGCVRDLLLGREPKDYDVATSAEPGRVLELFPQSFAVGAQFGVVLVVVHGAEGRAEGQEEPAGELLPAEAGGAKGDSVLPQAVVTEVATFRSDGAYSDGRHPDAVRYTCSAREDVQRRDFTINGLLLDPLAGPVRAWLEQEASRPEAAELRRAVIDAVGGLGDLEAGLVRAIGAARARFEEDRLRMLRAVRFAARYGFALEPEMERAIRELAPRIGEVSRERVREELTKMLVEGRARRAFELLERTGLLREVLPEAARMVGVEQPAEFHPEGDVWQHTLGLLEQLEAGCSMTLGWGALLHDVGKPASFERKADRIHFNGHAELGRAVASAVCRRFRFSKEETRQVEALVENHMRFIDVQRMREATLKRLFRLEGFEEHLALHRMDCRASRGDLSNWEYARRRWETMPAEAVRPRPLVTGRELMAAGYRQGPGFRAMLGAVEEAQLEGSIATAAEALALVRRRFGAPEEMEKK